jgi:hypothetical protein
MWRGKAEAAPEKKGTGTRPCRTWPDEWVKKKRCICQSWYKETQFEGPVNGEVYLVGLLLLGGMMRRQRRLEGGIGPIEVLSECKA